MTPMLSSTLFFLALLTACSTFGAILVTRLIPRPVRHAHRMLMQPALTVSGMMFSILLGFFIAQELRDYQSSTLNLTDEANAIGEVFRDAGGLPDVDRKRIRALSRAYTDSVINDEWPLINQGKTSPKTQEIMNDLFAAALSVNPTNTREQGIFRSFIDGMNRLAGYRRIRVGTVKNSGIDLSLWIIISVGAAAIVTLTFLFAPESKRYHAALLGCLIVPMTLNVYLLSEYSYPFSPGMVLVKPAMFESVKRTNLSQEDLRPKYLQEPQTNDAQKNGAEH
jgi:hypothetical protein